MAERASSPLRRRSANCHTDSPATTKTCFDRRRDSVSCGTVDACEYQQIVSSSTIRIESRSQSSSRIRRPSMLTKWIEMKACEHIAAPAHSIARLANRPDDTSPHISAERLRDADAGVDCRWPRKYSVDAPLHRLSRRHERCQRYAKENRDQ